MQISWGIDNWELFESNDFHHDLGEGYWAFSLEHSGLAITGSNVDQVIERVLSIQEILDKSKQNLK